MKRISGMTTALALALAASVALAQQPQTLKGVVIKGKTPINKEVLKVAMPKAYETELGNGMRVIVLENHKLPTFAMQMVVMSGGLSDPAGQPGAAQYAAAMLREGTKTRSSRQIAEAVESLGATLNAGSGLSSPISQITAGGLIENFDQIMELFADVILNPSFPADDLNKLKTRAAAQLRAQRSQPGFLANEMFLKTMYGAHPASRAALTPAQIQGITPEYAQAVSRGALQAEQRHFRHSRRRQPVRDRGETGKDFRGSARRRPTRFPTRHGRAATSRGRTCPRSVNPANRRSI